MPWALYDFGTQRTIIGMHIKVCHETKVELCLCNYIIFVGENGVVTWLKQKDPSGEYMATEQ